MIEVAGEWWGTAVEIAEHLGQGVTKSTVRRWAERDGLTAVRSADENGRPQIRYLLGQAMVIDRAKRMARRGRRRERQA